MKMLVGVGGDGKGLLHETIWLVAIAVGSATIGITIWIAHAITICCLVKAAATTFALHFAVGEKTARNSTGTPGLSVGPTTHTRFTFIPDEDRS